MHHGIVLCVNHQEIITHMENVCAPLQQSDQSNQLQLLGVKNQILWYKGSQI